MIRQAAGREIHCTMVSSNTLVLSGAVIPNAASLFEQCRIDTKVPNTIVQLFGVQHSDVMPREPDSMGDLTGQGTQGGQA